MKDNKRQCPLFLEFNSKIRTDITRIYSLKSVIIFRLLSILASQSRFQPLYDTNFSILIDF